MGTLLGQPHPVHGTANSAQGLNKKPHSLLLILSFKVDYVASGNLYVQIVPALRSRFSNKVRTLTASYLQLVYALCFDTKVTYRRLTLTAVPF